MEGTTIIKQLIQQPEDVIALYNLTYTTGEILTIKRIKQQSQFLYKENGEAITEEEHLKRIQSLVIPPAWEQVVIAKLHNAHLQATGRDTKNRKQYRYHPVWLKLRNETKFLKMVAFSSKLPLIRKRVTTDLDLPGWPRKKALALIVKLLEESHIRIGNRYYAKKNKTYGLATLRSKHLTLFKDKVKFEFNGKRGKLHAVTLRNKKLVSLINNCEEIPGWEVFKFYDQYGEKQAVDSTMVNEYIQEISGEIFSAKDFRTWAASLIAFDTLKDLGIPKTKKMREEHIITAIDVAANSLNNTRAVCRKYYIHPKIISSYLDGSIKSAFNASDSHQDPKNEFGLQPSERALRELLKKYKPDVLEKV